MRGGCPGAGEAARGVVASDMPVTLDPSAVAHTQRAFGWGEPAAASSDVRHGHVRRSGPGAAVTARSAGGQQVRAATSTSWVCGSPPGGVAVTLTVPASMPDARDANDW